MRSPEFLLRKAVYKPYGVDDNRLKLHRIRKGLTQKELASAAGMSHTRICKLESGQTAPNSSDMTKLSAFFNVEPHILFPRDVCRVMYPDEEEETECVYAHLDRVDDDDEALTQQSAEESYLCAEVMRVAYDTCTTDRKLEIVGCYYTHGMTALEVAKELRISVHRVFSVLSEFKRRAYITLHHYGKTGELLYARERYDRKRQGNAARHG